MNIYKLKRDEVKSITLYKRILFNKEKYLYNII